VKQKVKDFVRQQNEEGRLLWVRPFWRFVRNVHRFSPCKKLVNLLYYSYLVGLRKHRPLRLGVNVKNGIFYISVRSEGNRSLVVKVPHLNTRYSWSLYKKLRDPAAFREYCSVLLSISNDPILGPHFPHVQNVRRDGGYTSSYVTGHNLSEIRDIARDGRPFPDELDPAEVMTGIDELLDRLKAFQRENGTLCGDWPIYNLIYDIRKKRIINVDVEGVYTYQYPHFEADLAYIEAALTHLKLIIEMRKSQSPEDLSVLKVIGAVAYATQLDVSYSGEIHPMGYHSLVLRGRYFRGQRECIQRLADVRYDFKNKVVLDVGCNCGGMLHCLADRIRAGVGLDSERRCINAANLIKSLNGTHNLDFFTFDLDKEPLYLIAKFVLHERVDICFLLSLCMWLEDWRSVISYLASISQNLLFEANGDAKQQSEQVAFVQTCFRQVHMVNSKSLDDPVRKSRGLYLCEDAQV